MTAVRPEGRQDAYRGGQGDGYREPGADARFQAPEPDGWGVYEADAAAYRPDPGYPGAEPPYGAEYPWLADQTLQLRVISGAAVDGEAPTGGRAERRRAAQGRMSVRSGNGRRRAAGGAAGGAGGGAAVVRPKESKTVLAARLVGELCITLGLVMLLFVSYQLWWTNVQADAAAAGTRNQLEQQWSTAGTPAPGQPAAKDPGVFAPGQGFAILYVPKLGLKYPIAEGTDKQKVLDHGLVGHYTGTAMPADAAGNFAVAAHRTTHGQPFRKIGELVPGDKIVVETATEYYTYEVAGGISETPPSNVTVLQPIPKGSPFNQAGRYITMTTCTPEFSARGRLIVFGKMVDERPRSQGQPPALTS